MRFGTQPLYKRRMRRHHHRHHHHSSHWHERGGFSRITGQGIGNLSGVTFFELLTLVGVVSLGLVAGASFQEEMGYLIQCVQAPILVMDKPFATDRYFTGYASLINCMPEYIKQTQTDTLLASNQLTAGMLQALEGQEIEAYMDVGDNITDGIDVRKGQDDFGIPIGDDECTKDEEFDNMQNGMNDANNEYGDSCEDDIEVDDNQYYVNKNTEGYANDLEKESVKREKESMTIDAMKMDSAEKTSTENAAKTLDMSQYQDIDKLLSDFYVVDKTTYISAEELNVDNLLKQDLTIEKNAEQPNVLIYHTHATEGYADSGLNDLNTSVMKLGEELSQMLSNRGYNVLHDTGVYDIPRDEAYAKAAPALEQILADHPQIEVIIDLHRDGVGEGTRLVTEQNGIAMAQMMFFNGLSRTKQLGEIDYLKNENLQENLAFSFRMQKACMEKYPGLSRKIYLKGYRYNMQYRGKSLLVELGAQNNTFQEAENTIPLLAEILDEVLSEPK